MRFSNAFLDELRARISISEIVGAKLLWDRKKSQPARGDFWARCPFHQEKSSSFHVLEGKGIFYCFGCQAKGGALEFIVRRTAVTDAQGAAVAELRAVTVYRNPTP